MPAGYDSLAYKRPVVDGLKSVFSGYKKLYGLTNLCELVGAHAGMVEKPARGGGDED
jgi:hypothetical protein